MKKIILSSLILFVLMNDTGALASGVGTDVQTSRPATDALTLPGDPGETNVLARTDGYELQWWGDDQTGLYNFRRCVSRLGQKTCEAPILLNGLPKKDLPKFMAYYTERLDHWGSGHVSHFASVVTGSLGTATAYIGSFAAINIFKDALPAPVAKFIDSYSVRNGIHLVSIGTIGVLIYFAADNLVHFARQKELRKKLNRVEAGGFRDLPLRLDSRALYDELVSTFRRALYEYTHGGPPFDQSDNLVFQ